MDKTKTFCVCYDLRFGDPEDYRDLIDALRNYPGWWHHLESTWFILTPNSLGQIMHDLKRRVPPGSHLLVFEVGNDSEFDSVGLKDRAIEWLNRHVTR